MKEAQGKTIVLEETGLIIDIKFPFLATSPDRVVIEDGITGLLEVKHVLNSSTPYCRCIPYELSLPFDRS